MSRTSLLLVAALLAAAPFAGAHLPPYGPNGTPKPYCETTDFDTHDYAMPSMVGGTFVTMSGPKSGCLGPTDHHGEHARGGAYLAAYDEGPFMPGSGWCMGEVPHHPVGGPVTVVDNVIASGVRFLVAADSFTALLHHECGDFVEDQWVWCVDSCAVPFPPGLDGTYHVYLDVAVDANGTVHALTAGHVVS